MSNGRQATDKPHWPLIRVTRLWDVLQQAKNWNELCTWFFNHAGSGRYQMYWKVRSGYNVLCGTPFAVGLGTSVGSVASPKLPPAWSLLPKVKFVRLGPSLVKQVARQAYLEGFNVKPPIWADRFPGGLSVPDDISFPSGEYEALPVTVELHIASANPTSTNAWEMMDVDPTQVFIDDNVYDHIQPLLKDAPNVAIDVNATLSSPASATPSHEGHEVSTDASIINGTPSMKASAEPQRNDIETFDPYDLKVRAPAVYALYRAAELCHKNPDYEVGHSTRDDRKDIANAVLMHLAETSPGLGKVFMKTRREYVCTLIDPDRDPNEGLRKIDRREWPTKAATALLEQADERRQAFVYPTLELVIQAAEQWLAWKLSLPEGKTQLSALDGWLAKHGLTGAQERATLFPVITFDGIKLRQAPKSATPSISRARAKGGRRASH